MGLHGSFRNARGWVQLVFLFCSGTALFPQQPTNTSTVGPRITVPVSLASYFQIKKGFRIELVAPESMVSSPVAMAFDDRGRLFVVEMLDYPDARARIPHLGRVRMLEDSDGDGIFDTTTIYADNLPWPSAVAWVC